MRSLTRIFLVSLLAALFLPLGQVQSAGIPPAQTASEIRQALFNAQMALNDNPSEAEKALFSAQSAYSGAFARSIQDAAPLANGRILAGFSYAAQSIARGQGSDFAAARAKIWTSILAGSDAIVEQAIQKNNPATAQSWLPVREFRVTTRFSRPSTSATQAIAALAQGKMPPAEALLAVRADLFDTYQAELTETLHDLAEADVHGFAIRRAELAALAEGYFWILSAAYGQERGDSALNDAMAAFQELRQAGLGGQDLSARLQRVDKVLRHFRAAPLTPVEQARRAGQILRYLSLIPIEYSRGVNGTQVVHDFEIQEAITFHAGAYAAFSDLENLLDARNPNLTVQAKTGFDELGQKLDQAAKKEKIASAESIQDQARALSEAIKASMPAEWIQGSSAGDFDVIASMLDQMEAAVVSKDYATAEAARLEAYAIMEVGPEAHLMAFAPQLKVEMEDLFWNGQPPYSGLAYLIKNNAPHQEIKTTRAELDKTLDQAQTILKAGTAPTAVAVNAGMIMFREGLEAVIILASLMSSMKRKEEHKYRRPMWLGTLLALGATILTWVLAHDVLQSMARYGEKLEAFVSLIAIVVLLVIMNWFFHKLYWTEWIAGFHTRKRRIISGEAGLWLGLVMLGFTSVYREGFETVLFLQALVLESGLTVVLSGVAAALAAVCLVGFVTFRLQVNLPYKKMLIVTGVLIGAVLLQMVGTTVHVVQVVGWLPIHALGGQPLPYWMGTWFGIYATWEGVCLQGVAGLFVIGSYYLAEWLTHNRHAQKQVVST
jgi:high-affinity iron transporter